MTPKHSKQLLQGESIPTSLIEKEHWMKEIQAPKVANINMLFGELKLKL